MPPNATISTRRHATTSDPFRAENVCGGVSDTLIFTGMTLLCLLQTAMAPKKRPTPFQKYCDIEYGLWVTALDLKAKLACSVVCRFCKMFGREKPPGRKM